MSELREMHLSELLTILAEVPGDRIDRFNKAIELAKTLEAEHSALLRERDNLRNFIENIIKNECWDHVEYLDGGDVQDEAERMGVLVRVPHVTPCEEELCGCEGEDVDYLYNFAWRVSTLNTKKA